MPAKSWLIIFIIFIQLAHSRYYRNSGGFFRGFFPPFSTFNNRGALSPKTVSVLVRINTSLNNSSVANQAMSLEIENNVSLIWCLTYQLRYNKTEILL